MSKALHIALASQRLGKKRSSSAAAAPMAVEEAPKKSEPAPTSIAEAVMRKRKMAKGGMVEDEEIPSIFDEQNEAAAEDETDADELSAEEPDATDMIGRIRAKMKKKV